MYKKGEKKNKCKIMFSQDRKSNAFSYARIMDTEFEEKLQNILSSEN